MSTKALEKETIDKFVAEKQKKALVFVIRYIRTNNKFAIQNKGLKLLRTKVKELDDGKRSDRKITKMVMADKELIKKAYEALPIRGILTDDEVRSIADDYYKMLMNTMKDTTSRSWDEMEYRGQEIISVLTMSDIGCFTTMLKEVMNNDKDCPWFVKEKIVGELDAMAGNIPSTPTDDDEKMAEEIIALTCPGLMETNNDVFRALSDSLKWRGKEELQNTWDALQKTPKEKRKIRGRESCVFIEHNDGVQYVG